MEIRLIGTSEEIEAAMSVIQQGFTIHRDGGSYQGRNPRYASQNQNNRIRKLVASPRAIAPARAIPETRNDDAISSAERLPEPDDAVLGGAKKSEKQGR